MESESIQQVIEHTSSRPQAPIAQATTSPDVLALEPIQVTATPISSAQLVQEAIVVGHTMDISAQLVWEGKFSLCPDIEPAMLEHMKQVMEEHRMALAQANNAIRQKVIDDMLTTAGWLSMFIPGTWGAKLPQGIFAGIKNGAGRLLGRRGATKNLENTEVRTTRAGDKAVRITRPDGSVIDISPKRVKEFVPNTHPKAPPGTLNRVKFDNAIPGSKGFKRLPTRKELDILEKYK